MKTVVHVVVVVVVVLVLVLGLNGAITKISAGREVAAQQIHKATPDSVILAEYARELSKKGDRGALVLLCNQERLRAPTERNIHGFW